MNSRLNGISEYMILEIYIVDLHVLSNASTMQVCNEVGKSGYAPIAFSFKKNNFKDMETYTASS